MKVTLFFEFPSMNGGEHSMLTCCRRLQSKHDVSLTAIAPRHGPLADTLARWRIPTEPFSVRTANGSRRPQTEVQEQLTELVNRQQPDVVHANSLSAARILSRCSRINAARTGHVRDIMKLSTKAVGELNQLDALIAVSDATRLFHIQQGISENRIHRVFNGVDAEIFRPCPEADQPQRRRELRKQWLPQVPCDAIIALNVGQICIRKDQLTAVRAVRRAQNTLPDLRLVIAGERYSGKEESLRFEQAIRDCMQDSDDPDSLHLIGYHTAVADLMRCADVLLHTARQEPLGRVLLEAAACRLPIVATDVGGTPEILRPRTDALLIPPNDPAAAAAALTEIVSHQEERRQMTASARQRMLSEFTPEKAAERLHDHWAAVLQERSKS